MLSPVAALFVAVLHGAAAADLPITGAFGLEFGASIPDDRLGASLAEVPYALPPGNLEQRVPEAVPGEPSGWYLFRPQARPDLLSRDDVRFLVLRNATGQPVRILAEHPEPSCTEDVLWLTRSLARKYDAPDDPFGAERLGFRQSARFVSGDTQIDISCGPRLLIEYSDAAAHRRWLTERDVAAQAHREAEARLAEEQARLARERQRRLADLMTAGDRFQIAGAFGVEFGVPVNPDWLAIDLTHPDEPVPATLPHVDRRFESGAFTLTVGPDLIPVQVAAEFADGDGSVFEELAAALRNKYGPPFKDSPSHRIHRVNGDYAVARYLSDRSVARLVFIDDAGRAGQKARAEAAEQARLAQERRQFEEETAGL